MTPLIFVAVLLVADATPESSLVDMQVEAEAAYRAGLDLREDSALARPKFARAAAAYESLWNGGTRTVAVCRNLAQAHYLAGDLGRAISAYYRGLRLWPHDSDLRRGLEFAREQVAYPRLGEMADAAKPPAARTADGWPRDGLALLAAVLYALGWFALARVWVTRRGGRWVVAVVAVIVGTAIGLGLRLENRSERTRWAAPMAVVVSPGAELRTGNNDEYPRRLDGRLPAGAELHVLGDRGGWLHVRLANGPAGWVPRDRVVEVD